MSPALVAAFPVPAVAALGSDPGGPPLAWASGAMRHSSLVVAARGSGLWASAAFGPGRLGRGNHAPKSHLPNHSVANHGAHSRTGGGLAFKSGCGIPHSACGISNSDAEFEIPAAEFQIPHIPEID